MEKGKLGALTRAMYIKSREGERERKVRSKRESINLPAESDSSAHRPVPPAEEKKKLSTLGINTHTHTHTCECVFVRMCDPRTIKLRFLDADDTRERPLGRESRKAENWGAANYHTHTQLELIALY